MDNKTKVIRFEIDGQWRVDDMAQSLSHLRDLYNLRLLLQIQSEDYRDIEEFWHEMHHFPPFRKVLKKRMLYPWFYPHLPAIPTDVTELSQLSSFFYPEEQFVIRRIEYGSPGLKDLAGIGEIVGHIKDFMLKLIEYYVERRKRNLENAERELRNEGLRIENARKFVRLAKDCGYSESEIRKLTSWVDERQETFIILIENGNIRSVKILNDNKHDNID
ncbi:MAG: hypothetical protein JRI96_12135 [Deltaproteobacteria bacterium]|nr:hypothetical protein [Deltaproteobacteria bacterium]